MAGFEVLVAIVTVLAAVLLSVNIVAYIRERSWRVLFAGVVFALFLVKGMIMSLSILTTSLNGISNSLVFHLSFDVAILLFLFLAVMQAPKIGEKAAPTAKNAGEGKA